MRWGAMKEGIEDWLFLGWKEVFPGKCIGTLKGQVVFWYVVLQCKPPCKSSRHPSNTALISANPQAWTSERKLASVKYKARGHGTQIEQNNLMYSMFRV